MYKRQHYKTAHYAIGTAAHYRWNEWGYQETVLQLRLGENADAQIWINHPGETIHSGYGRPSYWGGSGTLPRLHHYRGLAVLTFNCAAEQPGFSHAWFPRQEFDASSVRGDVAVARSGQGMVMLKGSSPFALVETGPTAGNELRIDGHRTAWIVRLGDHGSEDDFAARFAGLSISEGADGVLTVEDPEYGTVLCHADGRTEAEGRVLNPADWSVEGKASNMTHGG